ncbi:HET-domain-containing protein [Trametes versicolor FP-101664 SS1]|uniref:HET-domain-containing protein n=1 Tax=Trametes versicolor (strain FP-101664) TaxID=717944 RepID=R7SAH7_TRAVS|nr:HET-domain-containing protein [Trametes versicolor FP-101664 SS1]EIW51969.1 HET-domain-containing protein [Trametes versicolor FP-101664 SS1]
MPRFLHTHTGNFVWIDDPESCSYAILSHTWRPASAGGEQSYDDVRKLQADICAALEAPKSRRFKVARPASLLDHPDLSAKIKGICAVARKAGFDLVWIDSCCIDKSSSAELSEAINSMFEWYRLADICYVYLADVPEGATPATSLAFWQSRWHTRGWTLQELIAPKHIVFLSRSWHFLGTKMGLAATLEKVTGIDFALLVGRASLSTFSVARRMSWAARRQTTRIEDKAYCLMGIFGIHMSPIYGEGQNSFARLQEEIIRNIPDQSIFAWGRSCLLQDERDVRSLNTAWRGRAHESALLARSPEDFEFTVDEIPLSPSDFATSLGRTQAELELPSLNCVFTPQGVSVRLLCLDLALLPLASRALSTLDEQNSTCEDCQRESSAHCLGLLQCKNSYADALIALPLCVPKSTVGEPSGLIVTTHGRCARDDHSPFRIVRLSRAFLQDPALHLALKSREVFIRAHPSPSAARGPAPPLDPALSVYLDPGCLLDLQTLGFSASVLVVDCPPTTLGEETIAVSARTTLAYGAYPQCPEQLLEVRVDLVIDYAARATVPLRLPQVLGQCSMIRFSIRHLFNIAVAQPTVPNQTEVLRAAPLHTDPSSPRYGLHEVRCADGGTGTRVLSWDSDDPSGAVDPLKKSIEAEFIIHTDARDGNAEQERGAFDIRLLRLALYAEKHALHEFGFDGLRLWIQLTEPYPFRRMVDAGRGSHIAGLFEDKLETDENLIDDGSGVHDRDDTCSFAENNEVPAVLLPLPISLRQFETTDTEWKPPPLGIRARAVPCEWATSSRRSPRWSSRLVQTSALFRISRFKTFARTPRIRLLERLKAAVIPGGLTADNTVHLNVSNVSQSSTPL